ncbi:MAG TPA: hypothetical protein VK752_06515 [Bryobacteraceae bacterium]|jgi:hypothetical protein|nr:hypothetical protein [Bryobacteraceae bacterium]
MRNFALLALAAVIAGSACAQGTTNTRTSTYTFPLVGLAASSEGIEVNLINLASNLSNGTAASCTGSVKFTTVSTGTVLAGGGTFTLASDAATSLAPTLGNNIATASNRILIRADLSLTITPGVPCSLASTLTTFDSATGVTHILLVGQTSAAVTPIAIFAP